MTEPRQAFRGDRAGGPCAILSCSKMATTEVTWAQQGRLVEHAVWYCEKDAQAALKRGQKTGRGAQITSRIKGA